MVSCACEDVLHDVWTTVLLCWAAVPPRYCCESSSWEKPTVSEVLTNSLSIFEVRRLVFLDRPRAWLNKYSRVNWHRPFTASHMGTQATFSHRSMLDKSGSRRVPGMKKEITYVVFPSAVTHGMLSREAFSIPSFVRISTFEPTWENKHHPLWKSSQYVPFMTWSDRC